MQPAQIVFAYIAPCQEKTAHLRLWAHLDIKRLSFRTLVPPHRAFLKARAEQQIDIDVRPFPLFIMFPLFRCLE